MRYKKYAALENSSGDPDSRDEAGRERHRVAPVFGYACCLNVVLTTGRLTWAKGRSECHLQLHQEA